MPKAPVLWFAIFLIGCLVIAPHAWAECAAQVVSTVAPTDGGAATPPALITPSTAGTPAQLINTGTSELVSNVLVFDTGVAPSCFTGFGRVIRLTYNMAMTSPSVGAFNGSPANMDIYDSAGLAGVAINAAATSALGPGGTPQTVIALTVVQAGTAGNITTGGTGSAVRLKNLRFDARSLANGALATVTVSATALAVSPCNGCAVGTVVHLGPIGVAPTTLNFGTQFINTTTLPQSVTLTNNGTATLTISSITTTNPYSQSNNCGGSLTAGSNCTIAVLFSPAGAGPSPIPLTITDNAPGSPRTVTLNGTGAIPPSPTLTSLVPNQATVGANAFTLAATGTNFAPTSVLLWNGASRTTTFGTSTQLTAAITSADVATAGIAIVTVSTPGGGISSGSTFSVNGPNGFPFSQLRYWPHVVTGNGYVTKMTITNLSNAQNSVAVYFVSQAGTTLETDSFSIAPAGTVRFTTPESARFGGPTTKWAIINSQAAVGINLFFEVILDPNTGAVANTVGFNDSPPLADFTMPVEFQPASSGFRTVGIACANVNNSAVTISMELLDLSGNIVGSSNLNPVVAPPPGAGGSARLVANASTGPVPAFGQTAADLQGTFGAFLPASNFLGSLTVHSTLPVSCVGLEDDLGLFSATPPISGRAK
jgi:hypothetical protein